MQTTRKLTVVMKDKNRNIVALKRFLNYDHRIWTLVVIITILLSRAVV